MANHFRLLIEMRDDSIGPNHATGADQLQSVSQSKV